MPIFQKENRSISTSKSVSILFPRNHEIQFVYSRLLSDQFQPFRIETFQNQKKKIFQHETNHTHNTFSNYLYQQNCNGQNYFHCVKSVQIRSYFWSMFSCIWTEYRKMRTRNNSVFGQFSRSVHNLCVYKSALIY